MWENAIKFIMWLIFIIMFLLLGMGGCASKDLQYVYVNNDKVHLYAGEIQQINLQKYNVELFNIDSTEYSCVKLKDYSIVIKNYQEMKSYIKQQKDIIEYYEKQIKDSETVE